MVNDKILFSREARRKKVIYLAKNSDVVTLKANVPGENKNLKEANLLVNFFINKVLSLGAKLVDFELSEDGATAYFVTEKGEEIKGKAQELEETHPLGRLVDIDVTLKGKEQSLSRNKMRKCFLCDREAFVCGREKNHSISELLRFIKDKTNEHISELLENIISDSMFSELNLENKFGLVTPSSNGSHKDLSYAVMKGAIEAIKKSLIRAFFLGFIEENLDMLMAKLIPLGLECEEAMLRATKNSNAYKGFIFVGGLILASVGYTLRANGKVEDIFKNAGEIVKNFNFPNDTFGASFYKKGFGGIREEATKGFPTVKKAEEFLDKDNLHETLIFIVKNLDDSVLLKRAGSEERYNYFKDLIINSKYKEEEVTRECIKNNVSIGGSADVLIASCMVRKIKENFYFKV